MPKERIAFAIAAMCIWIVGTAVVLSSLFYFKLKSNHKMEIQGTIKKIGEVQTFGSGFQKKEFVLTTEEQYPQSIAIELHSSRVDLLDPFKVGDKAKVGINILGKEWTSPQGETKYFNTIVAWKILKVD